jgi:hypothetical protein
MAIRGASFINGQRSECDDTERGNKFRRVVDIRWEVTKINLGVNLRFGVGAFPSLPWIGRFAVITAVT